MRYAILVAFGLMFAFPAAADPVEDFYRGKSMTVIVYSPAGSAYDLYARLLSRHMPRHIPGGLGMIAKNMTGAGGLTAARYLFSAAPKDGSVIGTVNRGLPFMPLLGRTANLEIDPLRFTWLGSMSTETAVAVSWHSSSIKAARDLFEREFLVGGTGAGSNSESIPALLNGLLGTRFKVISGYDGVTNASLAMERGEIDGFAAYSWVALKATRADWIRDHKLNYLFQTGSTPHPEIPADVPLVGSLAKNDADRQALRLLFTQELLGRPFLAPPDVPAERAQALRAAFNASMKDPALIVEAATARMELELVTAEEVEQVIRAAFATPADVIERTRQALGL